MFKSYFNLESNLEDIGSIREQEIDYIREQENMSKLTLYNN